MKTIKILNNDILSLLETEEWYLKKHPEAILIAAKKIFEMVNNFRDVMPQIDQEMVGRWEN